MTLQNRSIHLLSAALLLSSAGTLWAQPAGSARPAPITATGSVELTDPAGDVQPIVYLESVGDGPQKEVKFPGFDVLKLVITSDGKTLSFAATLKAPPSRAAYEVLEFWVDADNNAKTGITQPFDPRLTGLEFYGTLEDCLEHPTFGTTCAGTEAQPVAHSAVVTLEKYGKEWMNKDTLISLPAYGTIQEPKKTPVSGSLVQATVPYAALGVKSGQTLRLKIREACAGKLGGPDGFFPDVVLKLR